MSAVVHHTGSGKGTGGVRLLVLFLLSLLVALPLAADTWYEAYDRGVKRLRKGDATAAAEAFQAALALRSAPGRRVRAYGVRYIDYFPHLMLGRASLQLQQHDRAVRELEAALAAGAAPPGETRQLLEEARQQVARLAPPVETVARPPPVPTGVRLAAEGVGGRVRLSWAASAGADHYEVQQIAAGADWPAAEAIRSPETTALITGLSRGEIRGRVRAVSAAAGAGPWSPPVTVTLAVGETEARAAGERFEAGRTSMARGRFAEAAVVLSEAAGVMTEHTGCLAMLGTCHATLHFLKNDPARKEEALRWFRKLLEVDSSFRLDPQRVSPKIIRLLDGLR